MIENTIHVRTTRAALREVIAKIPEAARSGGATADRMMERCGLAALGFIHKAFITKARGGTDEAGDRWTPLSPKTIAYSKTRKRGEGGRTKTEKARPSRPSQALTKMQRERWWEVYRRALAKYRGDKAHAAATAWFVLKKQGATTLFEKYSGRQIDILRDTGLLLNSLSPGTKVEEQIFQIGQGEVIVGTNRKGCSTHHEGKGHVPQRRLWPPPSKWPSNWWLNIVEQARDGLVAITAQLIRSARR